MTDAARDASPLLDQAFSRAAGVHRVGGNRVCLLRDAAENYPAWLEAIAGAERYVHFESYIIRDDLSGRQFADALTAKARAGVPVRLLYDWMGALGKTPARYWAALRRAGVEARAVLVAGSEHAQHYAQAAMTRTIAFLREHLTRG